MNLGEMVTGALVQTVVSEAVKPTVQTAMQPSANMGALAGEPQPETLPRDSFLATEPNYTSIAVWGVVAYCVAKYFKWI